MIEPEDYGLSDVQTFAHIGDPAPSPDHSVFWKHWFTRLVEHTPILTRRSTPDPSDPSATHSFVSTDGVHIGCTLVLPEDRAVCASLVTVHGYNNPGTLTDSVRRFRRIANTGVAVLIIRLRGYPGSQIGIGDQTSIDEHGAGWIGRGFAGEKNEGWIVPGAVADVCNACRVMRNALLHRDSEAAISVDESIDHPGVFLQGSSIGGGLATISAAQLIGKLSGESIIDRLAISLPSLGAWRWRLEHLRTGTTAEIEQILNHFPERREELIHRLRLCDPVVHARKVRVPTLGMLARKDEVSPAPCAAAIFNAIDADPGRKWRFVVPFGHFEGSIANARRHALFERAMTDFFDPSLLPIDSMSQWEPYLHEGWIEGESDEHTPTNPAQQ
jgi:cephalosporin-C deacetylase-like acetyl esterase